MIAIQPAPDRLADRLRLRAMLAAQHAALHVVAATGDPYATLLARPGVDDPDTLHDGIRARGDGWYSRAGATLVSSYAGCTRVLRDRRLGVRDRDGAPADPIGAAADGPLAGSFLELDPPNHTRLRRLAAPAFRASAMTDLEPLVADRLEHVLARVEGHRFDLVRDVASPFPVAVIADLLGIPESERTGFAAIGMLVGQSLDGIRTMAQADRLQQASHELRALFTRLTSATDGNVGDRDAAADGGVLAALAGHRDADRMTHAELCRTAGLLLVAGFETTVNLLALAVDATLHTPGAWTRLADEPSWAPAVVEETLRWGSPVQLTQRIAHEPVEVGTATLAVGDVLTVDLAAANRDPEVFARPHVFDPDAHRDREHLAFSAGPHYCLGAPLARLEAAVALPRLARAFPRLAARLGATRRPSSTIRGFASYPVRCD